VVDTTTFDTTGLFPANSPYEAIPGHMKQSIARYVYEHIAPGAFLTAVICNDLFNAVNLADDTNLPLLQLYVQWFYNVAPGNCHGSKEIMKAWLAKRDAE